MHPYHDVKDDAEHSSGKDSTMPNKKWTVGELKEALEGLPEGAEVVVVDDTKDGACAPVTKVRIEWDLGKGKTDEDSQLVLKF
jgi:hypothetical protein